MSNNPIPWTFLDGLDTSPQLKIQPKSVKKSFAQVVTNNCDISLSQLPQPYLKGDSIAVKIPEDEYQAGLKRCKNHFHGRIIFSKGDTPTKFLDLKDKLIGGIGTPIALDEATNSRAFGHFAKVLVDINLKASLPDQILVEREEFAFFVYLEYENLPDYCLGCQTIGHLTYNCKKNGKNVFAEELPKPLRKPATSAQTKIPIGKEVENLDKLEKIVFSPSKDSQASSEEETPSRVDNIVDGNIPTHEQRDYVQASEEMVNQIAAKATRIVGRLWADEEDVIEETEESQFSLVLSKSKKTAKEKCLNKGIGNNKTRLVLKKLCLSNKPDLLFIAEPKGFCSLDLSPVVITVSDQQCSLSILWNNKTFFTSTIYAHTHYLQRRFLWVEIQSLLLAHPGPWCCIGDFNAILGSNECRSARLPNKVSCEDFQKFPDTSRVIHLSTRGVAFTWTNKRRGEVLTEKRLDKCLCNDTWISSWQNVACCTLPRVASDHHDILFCFEVSDSLRSSQFGFHKMWLRHSDCKRLVEESWSVPVLGCPMFILSQKLKNLKIKLKDWNANIFGNVHLRVKNALANVEIIQIYINASGPDPHLLDQDMHA
ncbi:PREDICTED: uncharacterized protein LOC109339967 [Lupinus angustifolius]|uniref:uncharacterized protein LOC109339967 n=1 Tax=Lupinus angustifolius TaxID=3871 RepID=UPI00092FD5F7|nr:PREDICTED: uncharacterized protein LOC109339967 [Lupinus angustifolius]